MPKCWRQIDDSKQTTCKDLEDQGQDVCSSMLMAGLGGKLSLGLLASL